jgi:hypothetical protein
MLIFEKSSDCLEISEFHLKISIFAVFLISFIVTKYIFNIGKGFNENLQEQSGKNLQLENSSYIQQSVHIKSHYQIKEKFEEDASNFFLN